MKKLLSLLFASAAVSTLYAQQPYMWGGNAGGPQIDYGNACTTDATGNLIVVGTFNGTCDFDFSAGSSTRTSAGGDDAYIAKYDATGAFLWAISFGGSQNEYLKTVKTDASGNIYVAGGFRGTCDFDPSAATVNKTSAGGVDMFIARYSPSGALGWAHAVSGSQDNYANALDLDASGYLYVTGPVMGQVDFDHSSGSNAYTANGGSSPDFFLARYAQSTGAHSWAFSVGSGNYESANAICVSGGTVIVGGYFNTSVDFDPGAGSTILATVASSDAFVAAYTTSAGLFSWAKQFGGNSTQITTSIARDGNGNLYVAGTNSNTIDLNPGTGTQTYSTAGGNDPWVVSLLINGTFIWGAGFGGPNTDDVQCVAYSAHDSLVYLCGAFSTTVDFDPGSGTTSHTTAGGQDGYVSCFDKNGVFQNVFVLASTGGDVASAIHPAGNSAFYVTGSFESTVDFDHGAGVSTLTAASVDMFTAKYGVCLGATVPAVASNDTSLCSGPSVLLSLSGTLNDATGWSWYEGSCGGVSIGTGTSLLVTPSATTTYYARGEGNCPAGSCGSLTITVNQSPAVTITGPTNVCPNSSITITASGAQTYVWGTTDTTASLVLPHPATGVYFVTGTAANGCTGTATHNVSSTYIDTSLTLVGNTLTSNNAPATYQWLDCQNGYAPVAGETGQSFFPLVNGYYAVEITENGCIDTSTCYAMLSTGIATNSSPGLIIAPNPARDFILLSNADAGSVITVQSADGKLVFSHKATTAQEMIETAGLAAGIYFISAESNGVRMVERVIIQ